MISYGKQNINQADIDYVIEVLKSDFLTQGPMVEKFEQTVADYCETKYAVAVTNATSALHIACLAAGLRKGDVLWTSPNTFVASANCGLYCGANVDFVDIDDNTYNMSVDELERKLRDAEIKPKVVIPVHFAGQSCDMVNFKELSKEYNFTIIEDASHATGASYLDTKVGSCRYSDMTVFSFHPVKVVTTGEGGMVLTNNKDLYDKLILYRSHGITRNQDLMKNISEGPWYYEQIDLGFNYRMTDIQAALGFTQMQRLDDFVAKRRYLAKRYNELLAALPIKLPVQSQNANSSWHIYAVRINFTKINISKKDLFLAMRKKGINLNIHYIPVHTQPYYKGIGFKKGDFPVSEKYYEEVFTLPLFYDLTDNEQEYIVKCLGEVLKNA